MSGRSWAAFAATAVVCLVAGCTESQAPSAIAESCASAAECIPGAECTADGVCRCPAGTVGCGDTQCADLSSDPENCGACGAVCPTGTACVVGECVDGPPVKSASQSATFDTPVFLNGGSPPRSQTTCTNEFEPVAARFAGKLYAGAFSGWYSNNTTDWATWKVRDRIPLDPNRLTDESGDNWTAISTLNDLIYVAFIGRKSDGASCIGVAAADPDEINADTWDYPGRCGNTANRGDQPTIAFDDGLRTLFVLYKNAGIRLDTYKNCSTSPGYTGCSLTRTQEIISNDTLQFGMDVSPCTNHAVVAYRSGGDVRLRFYDRDGNATGSNFLVASNMSWDGVAGNAGCGSHTIRRCQQGVFNCTLGNADSCMRDNARPSILVKYKSSVDKCYAVMAFDFKATASDGDNYIKNRFAVVDITNESSPQLIRQLNSTSISNPWNQYYSHVATNQYNNNVGWFWASDNQGACNVGWEGAVDTNLGLTDMSATGKFSGTFPAIGFYYALQDYSAGIKHGPSGGYLMPVWDQATPTSASCYACDRNGDGTSEQYSNAAKTTRILP
jgi:hypothetical protein